jgi:hypothetical protein
MYHYCLPWQARLNEPVIHERLHIHTALALKFKYGPYLTLIIFLCKYYWI